jgi:hypothetical protein
MDTIGRIRTAIFGNAEKKESSPKESAKNPFNSHATRSSAHINRAVDEGLQVNIKSTDTAPTKLSSDSSVKSSFTASSSIAQTSNSPSTLPSSSDGGSIHTTASITPTASSGSTPSGAPIKFTPAKQVIFSRDVQDAYYDKLRPEAKSLVNQYNLTKTEAAAIHAYTRDEYYRDMNAALRVVNKDGNVDTSSAAALKNAGITDDGLAEMIAATVSGMKKLPPDQTNPSVFLALGRNDSVPEEFLEPYAQGASITMGPFYSSTVSMPTVEGWWDGSDHFLSVLQNVNGNGRDISAFSEFPNEKEVLFMPGTRFMVLGRTERTETPMGMPGIMGAFQTKTKILLQLQEVSSNPNDALPPTIHPSTFQSLSAPIKEKKPEKSDSVKLEKKSAYFGLK